MIRLIAGLFVLQSAVADDFMPQKLEIAAPKMIWFDLQGDITIDVTVSSDAIVFFAVKEGISDDVVDYETGHLSWRYVNRADTFAYVSPPRIFRTGANQIVWDFGNREQFPMNYYCRFYIWAIDAEGQKQLVSRDLAVHGTGGTVQTRDQEGNPLDRPLFHPAADVSAAGADSVLITRSRWPIGHDPLDANGIENTRYTAPSSWVERGPLAVSPYDPDSFFTIGYDRQSSAFLRKFAWNTGGYAALDRAWGDALWNDGEGQALNGTVMIPSAYPGALGRDPGVAYIGGGQLLAAGYTGDGDGSGSMLYRIDARDGYLIDTLDTAQWWRTPEADAGSEPLVNSIKVEHVHDQPLAIIGDHLRCLYHVIDPHDYTDDFTRYATVPPVEGCDPSYGIPVIDQYGFALIPALGGADTAGLLAPDGSWMGLLSFPEGGGPGATAIPVDYDSPYDGLYFDVPAGDTEDTGLWYRGYDAFEGIIYSNYIDNLIRVTAPDGGETISAGSVYTIRADHYSFWRKVTLYLKYSLDNGLTWTTIDSLYTDDHIDYDWTVPDINSSQCKIRIVRPAHDDYDYGRDESNAVFSITGGAGVEESRPPVFAVYPASPNPFNPATTICYSLPSLSHVAMTVYNVLGRKVRKYDFGMQDAGIHEFRFDGADLPSGVYLYELENGMATKVGRMLLMK